MNREKIQNKEDVVDAAICLNNSNFSDAKIASALGININTLKTWIKKNNREIGKPKIGTYF